MVLTPSFDAARRSFLGRGALGLGALGLGGVRMPSGGVGLLNVAVVGLGRAGMQHVRALLEIPMCRVRAVCDVFAARQESARRLVDAGYGDKECNAYHDFRDLLRGEELDAVVVAAPDHWHAPMTVAACRAGVDVYCESPLTLTVDEGRAVAQAAERSGRLVQPGMAWRSDPRVAKWCAFVRDGHLGAIRRVRGEVAPGRSYERVGARPIPVPGGLRYDLWLGPAPVAPYHPKRCDGFRWIRDYAAGRLTEQGLHLVDVAQWLLGADGGGPTAVRAKGVFPERGLFDNAVRFHVEWDHAAGTELSLATTGRFVLAVEGTKGSSRYWPATGRIEGDIAGLRGLPARPWPPGHAAAVHMLDFTDSVLTRRTPCCPLEIGRRSADLCHFADLAMQLERELRFDPARGTVEDPVARRMLRRLQRPQGTMRM